MNELKNTPILLDQNSKDYADLINKVRIDIRRIANCINWRYHLPKADVEDVVSSTLEFFHIKYQADIYDRSRDHKAFLYRQIQGRIQKKAGYKLNFAQQLPPAIADDDLDAESSVIRRLENNQFESDPDIFNSDNYKHLVNIISKLNETSRIIINLKVKGYSNQEIAEELNLSYNVATVRLSRAKAELEQTLKKEGYRIPQPRRMKVA